MAKASRPKVKLSKQKEDEKRTESMTNEPPAETMISPILRMAAFFAASGKDKQRKRKRMPADAGQRFSLFGCGGGMSKAAFGARLFVAQV